MFDGYLQIDGVKGESQEDKHADWIEILSYNHHVSQPVSSTKSSAGGASTGISEHGDIYVTKYIDLATPKLHEAASTGKHFSKAVIEMFRQSGDSKVKYLSIKLEEVLISNVQLTTNGDKDHLPTETVGLNYGKIEWVYTQQKRKDGSGGGNSNGSYDLTKQKKG
jgi:type VI secretion system secreted protein Hcp